MGGGRIGAVEGVTGLKRKEVKGSLIRSTSRETHVLSSYLKEEMGVLKPAPGSIPHLDPSCDGLEADGLGSTGGEMVELSHDV